MTCQVQKLAGCSRPPQAQETQGVASLQDNVKPPARSRLSHLRVPQEASDRAAACPRLPSLRSSTWEAGDQDFV